MRRLLLFSAFFFALTSAREKSIFRPGDFFDPFREKSFADNQPSASRVAQHKGAVYSPFKGVVQPSQLVGYPRRIGKVSGTVEDFNAQLWHPNEFFDSFAKYGQPVAQQQPVALSLYRVNAPKAQARSFEAIVPHAAGYSSQPVVPKEGILAAKTNKVLSVPYKNVHAQSGYPKLKAPSPPVNVEPSDVVEQASKLVAQSSQYESHPGSHSASKSAGAGKSHHSGHHKSHGDKEVKDYQSHHHHGRGDHEKYGDHHKESHHKEKGGNVNKHHDEAEHYKKHHEGKKSHKAAKFGEKKGHKRGHKTKGYHNKFHRDEYHREHRFYDDYHKEGHHEKHGEGHSHYKKKEGAHKKGGSHKSGDSSKKHGEEDYSDKGKHVDDHKGFKKEGGRKKYHKHHNEHHKAGGSVKGKKYGYNTGH